MRILFLFLLIPLCFSAEKTTPWHRPDAGFRMEFQPNVLNEPIWLDFSRIVIPDDLKNGIVIVNSQGKTVSYHQYDGKKTVIFPEKTEQFFCYFGFSRPQGRKRLDRKKYAIPPEYRLRQANRSARTIRNPADWKELDRGPMSRFAGITRKAPDYFSPWYLYLAQNAFSTALKKSPAPPEENTPSGRKLKYFTDAVLEQMKGNLFRHFGRHQGRNTSSVFFHRRPYDTERGFSSLFHGRFYAPEDGIYCFRVHSNSTRILRVDDKELICSFGEFRSLSAETTGSSETAEVFLKKGTHLFRFLYAKGLIGERAGVFWKRKGETEYNLLTENEFMPAPPPRILKICSKNGTQYPVMERTGLWEYYTGKQEKGILEQIRFPEDPGKKWHWELNGVKWDCSHRFFALPDKAVFRWVPDEPGKGTVMIPQKKDAAPQIPLIPHGKIVFYGPQMLFDDEYTDLTMVCSASLPCISRTSFRVLPETPSVMFQEKEETLIFPPFLPERENKFASGCVVKQYFRFEGKDFRKPEKIMFCLSFPGLDLDSMKLKILHPEDLTYPLFVGPEGLKDQDGYRLMTVLHRKSLHEVRKWELTEKAVDRFRRPGKILVIGPDFGEFRTALKKHAAAAGAELQFISWSKNPVPSGSRVLNTFPEIMKKLQNCDADTALIIPPSAPERGFLGNREEINFTACLLELLEKRNMRVFLSSPLPFTALENSEDASFTADLRNLRREKGIDFIETEQMLKKMPQWNESVFHQGKVRFTCPFNLADKTAEILIREL